MSLKYFSEFEQEISDLQKVSHRNQWSALRSFCLRVYIAGRREGIEMNEKDEVKADFEAAKLATENNKEILKLLRERETLRKAINGIREELSNLDGCLDRLGIPGEVDRKWWLVLEGDRAVEVSNNGLAAKRVAEKLFGASVVKVREASGEE